MAIEITNLHYTYGKNTIFEYKALNGINLKIEDGSFTAIVGKTGSGKSSLIQHLNAILIPEEGEVKVDEFTITNEDAKKSFKDLRKEIGLVFQFSEYQLFEDTVLKDVMFGPLTYGMEEKEAEQLARKYLKMVNLDESLYQRSPFELSGGQKRRVAIAGILVMDPKIIVLDEPTAGLDPQGAIEVMEIFLELKDKYNKTLILVSHDMDFVYQYAQDVVLLDQGKVVEYTNTVDFFNKDYLAEYAIDRPRLIRIYERLTNNKVDQYITYDLLIEKIKEEYQNVK